LFESSWAETDMSGASEKVPQSKTAQTKIATAR
jgi:hypothetical protein